MNQQSNNQGSSNNAPQNNGENPPPNNRGPQQNDSNTKKNNGENLPPRGEDITKSNQKDFLNLEEEKKKLNPEMKGGYPENTGEIITNSILIRINESGDPDSNVDITQEELKKEKHISVSGTIECNGEECDYPLVVRILPFVEIKPGEPPPEDIDSGVVTTKVLSKKGDYSIFVPKSKVAVVIEVPSIEMKMDYQHLANDSRIRKRRTIVPRRSRRRIWMLQIERLKDLWAVLISR